MTNYERIKNMSIEEMTVLFDEMSCNCLECIEEAYNYNCPIYRSGRYCDPSDIKSWLESEVKEQ